MQAELALRRRLPAAALLPADGVAGRVRSTRRRTTVDGRFQGAAAVPRQLVSTGHLRGQARVTQVDWQDGLPVVTAMARPTRTSASRCRPSSRRNTIDSLSAVAAAAAPGRGDRPLRGPMPARSTAAACPRSAAHTVGEESCRQPAAPSSRARPCAATSRAGSSPASPRRRPGDACAGRSTARPGSPGWRRAARRCPSASPSRRERSATATMYLTQNWGTRVR